MSSVYQFNKDRCKAWSERMTKKGSKVWLMVGQDKNGNYHFLADPQMTPAMVANELQAVVNNIKAKLNQNVN